MSSDTAVGYMILTLSSLGYEEIEIRKAAYEMLKQMREVSEEEADRIVDDY